MKKIYSPAISLSFLFAFLPSFSFAQWSTDPAINTPICTEVGKQIDLRMIEDGKGGSIIVWKDYRTFNNIPDIYAQRVNAAGIPLWTTNGAPICTNSYDQSTPWICTDMNGGAIIAWSDWRSGIERDLYAQRIDSNGNVLWTMDGVGIALKQEREHNEKITSDGFGGAIIVWEQQRIPQYTWDVWAQRINSNGQALWPAGGIPLVQDLANRINGRVQADGTGGAYFVWQDLRNGFDYDIYAQKVDGAGNLLWGTTGKPICATNGTQVNPKIDGDSLNNGVYVAWLDKRNGVYYDVYAQRLDNSGNPQWAVNGVSVCNAAGNQTAIDILSNSNTEGLVLTWKDDRSGQTDIYGQKMDQNGNALWTANGVAICTSNGPQVNPNIQWDGASGAIVVWQDSSALDWDVKAQRIDSLGNSMWTLNGELVGTAFSDQTSPKNCSDGGTGGIFAFQDKRAGQNDIYVHHLYGDGNAILSRANTHSLQGFQASPNPFEDAVTLSFETIQPGPVKISITDLSGKMIREISEMNSGRIQLSAAENFPTNGVYLVTLSQGNEMKTLKVVRASGR